VFENTISQLLVT